MAENKREQREERGRGGRWKLVLASCALSLVLGGGAFYAVASGLVPLQAVLAGLPGHEARPSVLPAGAPGGGGYHPGAYVHLDPFVVSLGPESGAGHLKVSLVVEVAPGREREVEAAKPRLVDILNVFLRAVDQREFILPRSMERLRAQMLRRIQLVSPEGAVRDVLIQEFVIN